MSALLSACRFESPPDVATVSATVVTDGLWTPSTLRVQLDASSQRWSQTIAGNGSTLLTEAVTVGARFEASLLGHERQRCSLDSSEGVIEDVDLSLQVTCEPPIALDVTVSVPVAWAFTPTVTRHEVQASILVQGVRFKISTDPGARITLAGSLVPPNAATPPVLLADGRNEILLDVAFEGLTGAYQIGWHRGETAVRQVLYSKPEALSNSGRYGTAISADDVHLVVGAAYDNSAGPRHGSATVYRGTDVGGSSGPRWGHVATLTPPNAAADQAPALFGLALVVRGDELFVGAPGDSTVATQAGAVYRYVASGGVWSPRAPLYNPQPAAGPPRYLNDFGTALALDGTRLAVAAPGSGFVAVYELTSSSEPTILRPTPAAPDDLFGTALAFRGDTLIVGNAGDACACPGIDPATRNSLAPASGAVHVFRLREGVWVHEAYIKPSNNEAGDRFGSALSFDGSTLAVAAEYEASGVAAEPNDNSRPGAGAVYLFERTGNTWRQSHYLKPTNLDAGDAFSQVQVLGDLVIATSLAEDGGGTGAGGDSGDNSRADSGAAYIFQRIGAQWNQRLYLKSLNSGAGDQFGGAIHLGQDSLFLGAPLEDGPGTGVAPAADGDGPIGSTSTDSGAIYQFR